MSSCNMKHRTGEFKIDAPFLPSFITCITWFKCVDLLNKMWKFHRITHETCSGALHLKPAKIFQAFIANDNILFSHSLEFPHRFFVIAIVHNSSEGIVWTLSARTALILNECLFFRGETMPSNNGRFFVPLKNWKIASCFDGSVSITRYSMFQTTPGLQMVLLCIKTGIVCVRTVGRTPTRSRLTDHSANLDLLASAFCLANASKCE